MKFSRSLAVFFFLVISGGPVFAQKAPVFNHVALSVVNLKRSVHFYSQIIGLDSIPEPFRDGKHAWFSIGEQLSLHLIEDAPEAKTYYRNLHICFSTSNLKTFVDKIKKEGIEFENVRGIKGEVSKRIDGVQQIYFRDPDGYWIEMNDENKK